MLSTTLVRDHHFIKSRLSFIWFSATIPVLKPINFFAFAAQIILCTVVKDACWLLLLLCRVRGGEWVRVSGHRRYVVRSCLRFILDFMYFVHSGLETHILKQCTPLFKSQKFSGEVPCQIHKTSASNSRIHEAQICTMTTSLCSSNNTYSLVSLNISE
jgi:hypothetical protein